MCRLPPLVKFSDISTCPLVCLVSLQLRQAVGAADGIQDLEEQLEDKEAVSPSSIIIPVAMFIVRAKFTFSLYFNRFLLSTIAVCVFIIACIDTCAFHVIVM